MYKNLNMAHLHAILACLTSCTKMTSCTDLMYNTNERITNNE